MGLQLPLPVLGLFMTLAGLGALTVGVLASTGDIHVYGHGGQLSLALPMFFIGPFLLLLGPALIVMTIQEHREAK
jgi:hypothetical protein